MNSLCDERSRWSDTEWDGYSRKRFRRRDEKESRPTGAWRVAASSSRNGFRRFYCRADYNLGAAFRVVKGVLSGSVRKRYLRFGVVLSSEQLEGVWYTWRPAKLIVVKWVRFAARISLNKMW